MSLWGNDKDKEPKQLNRPDEIRKMGGHDGSMESAIADAPDSSDIPIPSSTRSVKSRTRKPIQTSDPIIDKKSQEDAARQAKIDEARRKIGENMMKDIAAIPYDVWAFIASDNSKSLSKEEEKELSDAYYLVAQSFNFSSSPTWMAVVFLLSKNSRLIKARVKSLKELEQTINEIKDSR